MTSNTCVICVEKINDSKNKAICCPYCDFEACKKCCQTYILGETVEKCMNTTCGKIWTRKFITEQFTTNFVKSQLKNHKKELLFERERGLLPATQPYVEDEIRKEKLVLAIHKTELKYKNFLIPLHNLNESVVHHNRRRARTHTSMRYLLLDSMEVLEAYSQNTREENHKIIEKLEQKLKKKHDEVRKEYDDLMASTKFTREEYESKLVRLREALGKKTEITRKTFVRACPDEDCRGFLSAQWKCGVCDKWTCPDCHLVKGLVKDCEHTCNPDDVATAKLITNDTKPCPNCRTGIFKIDGCDQMFCTQCHTGFSWKTGNIETRIHNPHYFEWMTRNRNARREARAGGAAPIDRNPLEVICGREIDTNFVVGITELFAQKGINITQGGVYNQQTKEVMNIARSVIHITEVELPRYMVEDLPNNQESRIKYMRGKMTEEAFKTEVYRKYKDHEKKRENRDVLVMLRNTLTDIIFRFVEAVKLMPNRANQPLPIDCVAIIDEMHSLIVYVNESFKAIADSYYTAPLIIEYSENYDSIKIIKKKTRT